MEDQRFKKGEFGAWVGIIGNILLAFIKVLVGVISDSKALIADGMHSVSDVIGSFAVLIGLKVAKVPPDRDHPYGHGKAENISAIVVSIILFIVGFEVGYSSIKGLFVELEAPNNIAIYAVILSIIVKEGMFQYKYRLGKKINSQAIIANAYEHRSDVYSSIAVLFGVVGAILGGKYQIDWLLYLDPLAGVFVSLLIMKMAYSIGIESIHSTLDHVLHEDDTTKYIESVKMIDGVLSVDDFYGREHGYYLIVDIKIGVSPNITVEEGHRIGKEVKTVLLESYSNINDVFVHVNPYRSKYPYKSNSNDILQ